ncbi:MAG TPA: cytochrome b N-terminal domain-containing protein, partial [Terriglobales bacterium]
MPFARIRNWLDERFGWDELRAPLRHKTVPIHRYSDWYFLGVITLFLFGVQVCTGILLLLYYRPSANEAFESVQYIMTQVQFGWLVRSVHSWAANLMIFTAFLHMFSVVFLRAYRKPRELTWVSGMLLLFLAMGFGFSGYLLPWNTLAFFATKVGTDIAGQVPFVGHRLMVFLRGGEEVTGATLSRFFGFHVAVLPGLTTLLVAIH